MANFYSTPIDGCFNCPMQIDGRCNQPYSDRPALAAVRNATTNQAPPPPGCILRDLPLYLHGRFEDAHPDGTEPRDRAAEEAVLELLFRDNAAQFHDIGLRHRDAPAVTIRKLAAALTAEREASKGLVAQVADLTAERNAEIARAEKATKEAWDALNRDREGAIEATKLRAELAKLRARPVLTAESLAVEIYQAREVRRYGTRACDAEAQTMADDEWIVADVRAAIAALGPAPLPSPDRAEELFKAYLAAPDSDVEAMRHALAALAKLSPAPARDADTDRSLALTAASLLRHIVKVGGLAQGGEQSPNAEECMDMVRRLESAPARKVAPTRVLVHADGGACHGSRVVDGRCVGCGIAPDMQSTSLWLDADARPVQCEPAKVVAPTLVAVSDEELADASANAYDAMDAVRAVRAKLGAAKVTAEALAEAWWNQMYADGRAVCPWHADALENGREIETKRAASVIARLRHIAARADLFSAYLAAKGDPTLREALRVFFKATEE
jgi:plasmid maintenance system antidote protein VapI